MLAGCLASCIGKSPGAAEGCSEDEAPTGKDLIAVYVECVLAMMQVCEVATILQEAKQWRPVSTNGAAMFLLNTTPKIFERAAQHFLGKDGPVAHALATSKDISKRSAAATEIVRKAASPYALLNNSIFSAEAIKRTRKACGYLDAEDDSNEGADDDSLEDAADKLGQLSPKLVQQCLVLSRWEQVS